MKSFDNKLKISVVSYLNTLPFLYGLKHDENINRFFDITLDYPAICADKILQKKADIGLIPVAVLPFLSDYKIITDYCIGANGKVKSVVLFSQVPLDQIEVILLDYQSRTSVELVQILAAEHWKIRPRFVKASQGYMSDIQGDTAGLVIGDRTFDMIGKYEYEYDLSQEWKKFTGKPFVFAVWVAKNTINTQKINMLNEALKKGFYNIDSVLNEYKEIVKKYNIDAKEYLQKYIDFELDTDKKKSLNMFLKYVKNRLKITENE